ncbi:hypothetical protein ABZX34_28420 [Streptomyces sp. NPDC004362]|uniref:hypothetical protein n=1 Tax=Streptomyces sp. NPDC004362 TaxID=3154456 RepID=UPI0033B3305C
MDALERSAAAIMEYDPAIDKGATLRHYFRHADEEGGLWYLEAVPDRGELILIKQAERSGTSASDCLRDCR